MRRPTPRGKKGGARERSLPLRKPKRYDSDLGLLILDFEDALKRVGKVGREITLVLEQHLEDLEEDKRS